MPSPVSVVARSWRRSWPPAGATWKPTGFSPAAFQRAVVKPTLDFSGRRIDAWVIGLGLVPTVKPAHILAWVLKKRLLGDTRLDELPDRPRFIFNAASVATGVSWVFQKPYMGDARLGIVKQPRNLLAEVVAASASFPPVVAPFWLDLSGEELLEISDADLFPVARESGLAERVLLLDGGAYDNLGVEPLEGRCSIVLASSAGGDLKIDTRQQRYRLMWPLLRRTLDMAVEVSRAQRRRALIDRATATAQLPANAKFRKKHKTEHVALWRTSNDLSKESKMPPRMPVADGWDTYLASRKTRLWPMPMIDRHRLINWGYLTSDVMLRTYVPELREAAPASAYPYPKASLDGPPPVR